MKKLLLDIHIYSGLLCTAYLIIYGLSTISFNHHHEPSKTKSEWARAVDVPSIKGPAKERDQKLAASPARPTRSLRLGALVAYKTRV